MAALSTIGGTARAPRHRTKAMTGRPPSFAAERMSLAGAPGVRVQGEVDVDTVPELRATLEAAMRESTGAFLVDLSQVEFMDSTGVSVLLRARALLGREERDLVLVCPPGPARRVLEITAIADLFVLFGSRAEAAASLRPA